MSHLSILNHLNNSFSIGVRYMLLSAAGFAFMAVCVKQVSTYGIPVLEIIAARALVSLFISYVDVKRKKLSIWGNNKPLLIARGFVGTFALICVYYAVITLPLAEATLIQYLYPAFTAVIALIFLKEKVHLSTLLCIILSIIGLLILLIPEQILPEQMLPDQILPEQMLPDQLLSDAAQSKQTELPSFSVIVAILGALGTAVAYVLVRKLSQSEDSSVIIFYFPFIALPISILLPGDSFILPNLESLGLLILVGLFTQIGQIGLTKAMQTDTAGKATAYSYVQVIFAVILGWIFFAEAPAIWFWVGGSLIILGALINTLWKH